MSTPGASTSSGPVEPSRSEAEPLPRKVAEFGYVSVPEPARLAVNASTSDLQLNPHPAEQRDGPPPTPSRVNHAPTLSAASSTTSLPMSVNSRKSSKVYRSFVNFIRGKSISNKPMPMILGIELPTLVRLIFTIIMLIGVLVGWAITVLMISKHNQRTSGQNSDGSGNSTPSFSLNQDIIFIHTGFAIATLIVCILLERAIFMTRADRYAYTHPQDPEGFGTPRVGQRGRRVARGGVAFAPWNRPPLPTYANAVGFRGTGDVEDAQIAAPPPPEYGNTRGSTLLLSTFFGSQAPPGHTSSSSGGDGEDPRGRPVSYASRVSVRVTQPERAASRMSSRTITEDAWRARRLEESLASLEGNAETANRPPTSLRAVRR